MLPVRVSRPVRAPAGRPRAATAIQEVRAEANKKVLDQAVSEGKLTQTEADAVAKAAAAGIAEVRGAGSGPR